VSNDKHEFGGFLAEAYRKYIRPVFKNHMHRQRIKMLYDVWFYLPLLGVEGLGFVQKVVLIFKMIRIDWNVLIGSKPAEVVPVLKDLMSRRAQPNEVFIEAGCWFGGSTSKFSLVCKLFGYEVHVYDSFQGVKEWNYLFAAPQKAVESNIAKYGELSVCFFHAGWFSETFLDGPVPFPVRMVYIDCDVAGPTKEVMNGVLPALVRDGVIYTQDYHLDDVKEMFADPKTWTDLHVPPPTLKPIIRNLARIFWAPGEHFG
jgi:O-methyltransferase